MPAAQENRIRTTFAQHGVVLQTAGPTQYLGPSPWADWKPKLYVNKENGLWDCKASGMAGNLNRFFEEKSKLNEALFRGTRAKALADTRGLPIAALRAWRIGWDGKQYTIPCSATGRCMDLRRYELGGRTMGTAGAHAGLSGVPNPGADVVYLAEGEWDGVATWDMVAAVGEAAAVYAAPGANVLPTAALELFRGKKVRCLYDNDDAGRKGTARVARLLAGVAAEVLYLNWPVGEYPDGYDVRDHYRAKGPGAAWADIQGWLGPKCPGGETGATVAPQAALAEEVAKLVGPGMPPAEVLRAYRRWLYLPNPEVLDILYGVVFANRLDGDPIWLFLVAPPGGTKTELIMSLADAPLIRTISTITPRTLVSGAAVGPNAPDPSLLPQLHGRILSIKDFTTILSMPQQSRDEIFGTLREAYDGRFEKSWGTGLSRRYDVHFGILAGVTPIIEKFANSSSVLGERFLKYRLPRQPRLQGDDALIDAALANLNAETEMRSALQEVSKKVLNRPPPAHPPTIPAALRVRFRKLAQWCAVLRGVVSRERFTQQVEFRPTAEVGTRLAKQLAKLAQGITLYHGRTEVDEYAYQAAIAVARGTVPDRVEEIIRYMYLTETAGNPAAGIGRPAGSTIKEIAKAARLDGGTIRYVLQDLALLKAVTGGIRAQGETLYMLTKPMRALMDTLDLYRKEGGWLDARQSTAKTSTRKTATRRTPAHAGA